MESKNNNLTENFEAAIYALENTPIEEAVAQDLARALRFFAVNTLGLNLQVKNEKSDFTADELLVCLSPLSDILDSLLDKNYEKNVESGLYDLNERTAWFLEQIIPFVSQETILKTLKTRLNKRAKSSYQGEGFSVFVL